MADLSFSSYLQGPLGEANRETDTMGPLVPSAFTPSLKLTGRPDPLKGPDMRLLGPGDVAGLSGGTVIRVEPSAGAADVEPNYMAVVEVVPAELPWVLTPAKAASGRLRPWFVLIVLEEAKTPLLAGDPLPTVEPDTAELPDLRDSWGWAHVQSSTGSGTLPGGGQATAGAVARLVCPRRLAAGSTYRACLVPAFASGVAAGLGKPDAGEAPHDLAWNVSVGGTVQLPVYHDWTFTTGPSGDFEKLVNRLEPADPEMLLVSSVRPVDVRAPWRDDTPLTADAQLVGVQGALIPFDAPPVPEPAVSAETLAAFDERIRAHLDAPAQRLLKAPAGDTTGTLAPPLYGGRHVSRDVVEGDPAWLAQLNTSIANRIAAGLGADYVRVNQEDLMAKAWQQVGAIREANRLRGIVELTTEVAVKAHERHVATLQPGEVLAFAAPAEARTRTSETTTLAMETRMSRMANGAATSAFARRVRPAGKLAQRTGVTVRTMIPKALTGEVTVPAEAPVIPETPTVVASGLSEVSAEAAAMQLVVMASMVRVAEVNQAGAGVGLLTERIDSLHFADDLSASLGVGSVSDVATAIAGQVGVVSELTKNVLADMSTDAAAFGSISAFGVPIVDSAIAARISAALQPGSSQHDRLASQTVLSARFARARPGDPIMACPDFPVPMALALLEAEPEWVMPGLGALPNNKVALMRQNGAFIESYLAGLNHEIMRELLWREYPTDRRGTPFTRFWPRLDGAADIPPIHSWVDAAALGEHLTSAGDLSVLLVRGDVVRRYPAMVVTAVRSGPPDPPGRHRPDPGRPAEPPAFPIKVDESTMAYAFDIPEAELMTPATAQGWFFVFAEHGFRIRFGFDEPPLEAEALGSWNDAAWPVDETARVADDPLQRPASVPVALGHALAGANFGPPANLGPDAPRWNLDACDIARITLQRPFRVAVQAGVLLHPKGDV